MYTPPGQPFFPPPQQGPDLSQLLLKNAQIALSTYARLEVDQHLLGKLNVERVRKLPPTPPCERPSSRSTPSSARMG